MFPENNHLRASKISFQFPGEIVTPLLLLWMIAWIMLYLIASRYDQSSDHAGMILEFLADS